jgi:hypothetical protein
VNTAASTADWLQATAVGAGSFTVVAVAMKAALDRPPHPLKWLAAHAPTAVRSKH